MIKTAGNIVLAIVGLTVVNSAFVLLLSICANIELTYFKTPTIANTRPVSGQAKRRQHDLQNNNNN